MLPRFTYVLLALTLSAQVARADCECLWQGSFVDVQSTTDLVVSGQVVAGKGNSIDLELHQTLRGTTHQERIRIWLHMGELCRPPAELFPQGSEWVMALDKLHEQPPGGFDPATPNISYGRVGDYSLSSCGGYWLNQSGSFVTGNLIDAPRWEREPKMSPVLIDLVQSYIDGKVERSALAQASREDPALKELMLDTRAFLREE